MGCCFGRERGSLNSEDVDDAITVGKNRPLIFEKIKWKSDVTMTEGQLRSKRDEFWETAPAFEGRKEIWDALRAALNHAEQGDLLLAQAILDGANISLPDGTLRESYDELGNRYQVPLYCLSAPVNLIEDRSESSSTHCSDHIEPCTSSSHVATTAITLTRSTGVAAGQLLPLKFRLSTSNNNASEDVRMDCRRSETVMEAKWRLHQLGAGVDGSSSSAIGCSAGGAIVPPPNQQRWVFGGRVLADKTRLDEYRIPAHYVVQVIVSESPLDQRLEAKSRRLASAGSRGHSASLGVGIEEILTESSGIGALSSSSRRRHNNRDKRQQQQQQSQQSHHQRSRSARNNNNSSSTPLSSISNNNNNNSSNVSASSDSTNRRRRSTKPAVAADSSNRNSPSLAAGGGASPLVV